MNATRPTSTADAVSHEDRLLCEKNAARFLGLSIRTLQAWRHRSVGPSYVRAGRSIRYRLHDLNTWITRNTVTVKQQQRIQDGAHAS
jgi:predicted DNA-binding transcriptional regulator AlpA